jgi:SHS2 domain-containing protein
MMRPYARTEEHVGEWKVTIRADSLAELFAEVARVVARTGGRPRGAAGEWEHVSLTARDAPTLLIDWVNELIGRSEINHRAYHEVRFQNLEDGQLEADIRGRQVEVWLSPLKAATYHRLELARDGGRWRAVVLFDV